MPRIEAYFGGALALFVLAVAIWALINNGRRGDYSIDPKPGYPSSPSSPLDPDALICQCFEDGFKLAGSDVGVMSAQYRTGFEYCRAQLGDDGGCAWTAGWNAKLSARPFDASCRAFIRRPVCD